MSRYVKIFARLCVRIVGAHPSDDFRDANHALISPRSNEQESSGEGVRLGGDISPCAGSFGITNQECKPSRSAKVFISCSCVGGDRLVAYCKRITY